MQKKFYLPSGPDSLFFCSLLADFGAPVTDQRCDHAMASFCELPMEICLVPFSIAENSTNHEQK